MSKFRLSWARQCGERKAKEFGFEAFPVDPFRIAEAEAIHVEAKPADRPELVAASFSPMLALRSFTRRISAATGFSASRSPMSLATIFLRGTPRKFKKHPRSMCLERVSAKATTRLNLRRTTSRPACFYRQGW